MKKSVFEILNKNRNIRYIYKSDEFRFYQKYKEILFDSYDFNKYADVKDNFDIIKANIILRGILNKNTLDKILKQELNNHSFNTVEQINKNIKGRAEYLTHMVINDYKIYIPFFNIATNYIYLNDFFKLNSSPYDSLFKNYSAYIIDTFECYKDKIFESQFTELVKVTNDSVSNAFYHFGLRTIFIINNQGFLDNYICIFDKNMSNIDESNLIERIKIVVDAYYKNDINKFIYSLYEGKLISNKVFIKLCKVKGI